tara:strand:- start:342 stop:2048 length:1707 start_codon:yes stop_codon:yes gene_type:complete
MSIKITLINPPQIFSKSQVASGVTPPLGVAYLASYLLAKNIAVQVIDALGEAPETINPFRKESFLRGLAFDDILEKIDSDSQLIGISNLFTFAYPAVEVLCQEIRKSYPDKKIILGGPHPTAMFKTILDTVPEVDFVALGEGEESLYRLIQYLEGKLELEDLTGVALRESKGGVIQLNSTKRILNLNQEQVPFPARHLLPMENYIRAQESHGPTSGRWTSMLSSRGCPYGCTFCESRRTKWIGRTAKDVVDEMEQCMKEYGITEFHFEDDMMTANKTRLIQICDEIIERRLTLKWQTPNGIRASLTDPEMLAKMKAAGCMHVTLAPESGSMRVLKEIIVKGADFELDQLLSCGKVAHQIGLKVAAFFILGLPGENLEDMEKTIRYARKLAKAGVDEAAFSLFIPLPGTPLWGKVEDQLHGIDFLDLLAVGDLSKAKSWNPNISDEKLHAMRRKAYLSFHLTKLFYHPMAFLRSLFNVLRDIEETKTERTLRQFLKRFNIKKKNFSEIPASEFKTDLDAYPYDAETTLKILMQNKPNHAYSNSLLKAYRLVVNDILGLKSKEKDETTKV